MEAAEAVGLAVRHLRLQLGRSQEEIAWEARVDRTYLSSLERGLRNPALTTLRRLADTLDIRLSRLIAMAERIEGGDLAVERPERRR